MEQERLWTLLGKKLAGAATKEELQELELLLLAYGEDADMVEIIERMWNSRKKNENSGSSDAVRGGDAIRERIDTALGRTIMPARRGISPARRRTGRWLIGAAAVILTGICFIAFHGSGGKDKEEKMLVLFTRKRSHSNLQFPDGTTVVLNENSKISYNADFGKVKREIILEGEAYFDVAKNPGVPLIIHAKNVDIKVLGTSFNVKAYPSDKRVETSLIKGAVEVSSKLYPDQKVVLRPNEKVNIAVSGETIPEKNEADEIQAPDSVISVPVKGQQLEDKHNPTDTLSYNRQPLNAERTSKLIPEIAWMYRKLVFNQESFESVAEKMERWYGVRFYFEDDDLKKEVFTGSFSKETLEEGLKALQFSYPFDYVIKKSEVFIKRKK